MTKHNTKRILRITTLCLTVIGLAASFLLRFCFDAPRYVSFIAFAVACITTALSIVLFRCPWCGRIDGIVDTETTPQCTYCGRTEDGPAPEGYSKKKVVLKTIRDFIITAIIAALLAFLYM